MVDVSVPLAIYDFVPVIISAVALGAIARVVATTDSSLGRWASLGVALVVGGGLARASWKLVVAAEGTDLRLLHDGLYVLLAPGFLLLGTCVWRIRSGAAAAHAHRAPPWLPTAVVIGMLTALSIASQGAGRVIPLLWLATATAGVAALTIGCAMIARRRGRPAIGSLFLVYLAITLALNGFARSAEQTEAVQWVEQSLNALNQLLLLAAARRLPAVRASDPAIPLEAATPAGRRT